MATEAPLIRDGAQCQAAANYWNPSTTLYGANGSGQFLAVFLSAARTVTIASNDATVPIYGILQNTPDIGQAADVGLFGITKAVSGAAISAGVQVMLDTGTASGRLITWSAGTHNIVVGYALEAAGAANALFTIFLVPAGGIRS
jgi:hypothetical protein